MTRMDVCANCGSNDRKALPLVYRAGIIQTRFRMSIGGVHTRGVDITELAKKAAPPTRQTYWVRACTAIACAFTVMSSLGSLGLPGTPGMMALFIILCWFCSLSAYHAYRYNAKILPIAYEQWQNAYMCLRCGLIE